MIKRGEIVVGLSGGVDSAVAALLLQREGYDVHAVFMKNWSEDDFGGPCPWAEDQASAKAVADKLKISLETWNYEKEYRDRVFEVMLETYRQGRTPNPDILCNQEIKFAIFLAEAEKNAPLIATGHYARTESGRLYKAVDEEKDQSYFLAGITSAALEKTVFPLGGIKKDTVRKIAQEAGLPNWDRPDSTGICFIGEKKMREFIGKFIPPKPGEIKLEDGTTVGRHSGLHFYTIGQRHGFGQEIDQKIISKKIGAGKALYVKDKDIEKNFLIVAAAEREGSLTAKSFYVEGVSWIRPPEKMPWSGGAKLRYRQTDVAVTLQTDEHGMKVVCAEPQRAVTPGQYAVFYEKDECLGCGVIGKILK